MPTPLSISYNLLQGEGQKEIQEGNSKLLIVDRIQPTIGTLRNKLTGILDSRAKQMKHSQVLKPLLVEGTSASPLREASPIYSFQSPV